MAFENIDDPSHPPDTPKTPKSPNKHLDSAKNMMPKSSFK